MQPSSKHFKVVLPGQASFENTNTISSPGWQIDLPSDVDWKVFLGVGQLYAPTHSNTVSLESFTFRPNTKNYVTFEAEKYEFLKKRGWFNSKQYCEDDIEFIDTVLCKKRCMLKKLKVYKKQKLRMVFKFSIKFNCCKTLNETFLIDSVFKD